MFRNAAFPDTPDYTASLKDQYFKDGNRIIKNRVFGIFLEKRKSINQFLDNVIDKYSLLDSDIIGISSAFSQNIASFALARRIKEKKPYCIIAMGGPNCEYPMGKAIIDNIKAVDFVFSGPEIIAFRKFVTWRLYVA